MIVVRVDLDSANPALHPDRHFFTMVIGNDGSGGGNDSSVGNYNVYLGRRGVTDPLAIVRKPLRTGRVENHARLSSPVKHLVLKALESVK